MSRGRLSFNLQDEDAMKKFREYIGVQNDRGKDKRVAKNEERGASDRDMRDTSEGV